MRRISKTQIRNKIRQAQRKTERDLRLEIKKMERQIKKAIK
ncbi:hypothetical protein ACS127_05570 [Amphibacillus sp. Q70]